MIINKSTIEKYNEPLIKEHQRKLGFIAEGLHDVEGVIKKLIEFQVPYQAGHLEVVEPGSAGLREAENPALLKRRLKTSACYIH